MFVKLKLGEGGDMQEVTAAVALAPERLLSWGLTVLNFRRQEGIHMS